MFTGDGTVDINDLTIVLANFGTTYGVGGHCRRAGAFFVSAGPRCR